MHPRISLSCAWIMLALVACGRTPLLDAAAAPDARPQVADAPPDLGTTPDGADAARDAGKSVLELAVYWGHSAALLSDGTVKCWGYNKSGQVGDGTDTDRWEPVPLPTLPEVVHVAPGGLCVILAAGTVRCWSGAAGNVDGGTIAPVLEPQAIRDLPGILELSSSYAFACARLADRTTRCWGYNGFGRLGDGTTDSRPRPALAKGLDMAVQLSTGPDHSCASLQDGTAKCWGWGGTGCLGDGSTDWTVATPVTVHDLSGVVEVAAGTYHACARLADGTAKCWGFNRQGELGDGTTTDRSTPVSVQGLSGADQIVAGYQHSCARLRDGTVKCWGGNANGELGDGTTTDRLTPVTVAGLPRVADLAAGTTASHWCARLENGGVSCWGANDHGQLGDGTTTTRLLPVEVRGLP